MAVQPVEQSRNVQVLVLSEHLHKILDEHEKQIAQCIKVNKSYVVQLKIAIKKLQKLPTAVFDNVLNYAETKEQKRVMKYSWGLFVDTHGAKSKLEQESNDNNDKFKQFYYQADTHYTKDELKFKQELLKDQILISRNGEVDVIPN